MSLFCSQPDLQKKNLNQPVLFMFLTIFSKLEGVAQNTYIFFIVLVLVLEHFTHFKEKL